MGLVLDDFSNCLMKEPLKIFLFVYLLVKIKWKIITAYIPLGKGKPIW